MGYAIAPTLIVLIALVAAGALVVCLYGIFRFYGEPHNPDEGFRAMSPEQMSYLQDVRNRNLEILINEGRRR
jgi:hypothetical protein